MADLALNDTAEAIADLIRDALGLAELRVLAAPPVPLVRPCVWVDTIDVGTREEGTTHTGPSIDVVIYATADGDNPTQTRVLRSYVETIWRALSLDDRFAPANAVRASVEDAVPFPSYRITAWAWMF